MCPKKKEGGGRGGAEGGTREGGRAERGKEREEGAEEGKEGGGEERGRRKRDTGGPIRIKIEALRNKKGFDATPNTFRRPKET